MTTKPQRIINIHGHLRHDQDIPARIKLWQAWNKAKSIRHDMASSSRATPRPSSRNHKLGGHPSPSHVMPHRYNLKVCTQWYVWAGGDSSSNAKSEPVLEKLGKLVN